MEERQIGRAGDGDAGDISDLDVTLFDNGLGPFTILRELRAGFGFVARGPEGLDGYVLVRPGPLADVTRLGVREGARGRGLGRALLALALDAVEDVMLTVRFDNALAGRMYERAGFRIVARCEGAWVMRRYPPNTTASPNSDPLADST